MSIVRSVSIACALVIIAAAGCAGAPTGGVPAVAPEASHARAASLQQPALVAFDTQNHSLAYWPIRHGGGEQLDPLTGSLGIDDGYAMAANGETMVIANYSPGEIVTYDLKTKAETTGADPYGQPYDVAVDRKGAIYAMNKASVAVFKTASSQPSELTCSYVDLAEAIAVNNEGDVFVDGYGPNNSMGVVEYPHGTTTCTVPHLRASRGYIAGVGVDPKTDDLIVIDDPDLCAGGIEGRMTIYPKPYEQRTSVRRVLATVYCAGVFRLDASSTHIFYSDATVSAGFPLIDQARYPSGKYEGVYQNGYYSGGNFAGFTTLPNRLPN
jgi:hypothetical protein